MLPEKVGDLRIQISVVLRRQPAAVDLQPQRGLQMCLGQDPNGLLQGLVQRFGAVGGGQDDNAYINLIQVNLSRGEKSGGRIGVR